MSRLPLLLLLAHLAACATLTGEPLQSISIHTVDAYDRSVAGWRCRAANGAGEYFGDSPLLDLRVRRSASDLEIECRRGGQLARGTAIARGSAIDGAVKALLPGGTAMLAIDHLSGYRYAYPQVLRLRIGQHLVFDAGDAGAAQTPPAVLADSQ